MSRYYRYPEPTHWRKLGKLHRPRLCVLCTVEHVYKRLGLLSVEPDWWGTTEINRDERIVVKWADDEFVVCDHSFEWEGETNSWADAHLDGRPVAHCPDCGTKL